MSPEVADRTLRAAAEVERALKRSTPPFDDRGDRLLARCSTLGLAPLIDPPDPGEDQSLERFL